MTTARFATLLFTLAIPGACRTAAVAEEPDTIASLTLNEGAKWVMDAHTRSSIARMQESFGGSEKLESPKGYRDLGHALMEELRVLIGGCTMIDPAHDQLHVFLTELMPRVYLLEEASEPEAAEKTRAPR